ncbi:MAG: hypothetical protein ACTSRK_14530 [Promethearchaeota archaeon]
MSENDNFKEEEKTIFLGGFVIIAILLVIFILNGFPVYLDLVVGLCGVALVGFYFRSQAKEQRYNWIKEFLYAKERTRKKEEIKETPEENLPENSDNA